MEKDEITRAIATLIAERKGDREHIDTLYNLMRSHDIREEAKWVETDKKWVAMDKKLMGIIIMLVLITAGQADKINWAGALEFVKLLG